MELRVDGRPLAVTMRTPGHDVELAHGFLLTEGVITAADQLAAARYCDSVDDSGRNTYNVLDVALAPGVPPPDDSVERRFYTTSSCGVCGKGALEEVAVHAEPIDSKLRIERGLLARLPDLMRQPAFARSGGLHATGLFTARGELRLVREDVGRHNAMDKVIGEALLQGWLPLSDRVLCVSGRLAFELVQKAAVAGAPVLVGVGAPTSLAVELAEDRGLTLAGFARGETVNVYTHPERVR
jgi:FdhD protein